MAAARRRKERGPDGTGGDQSRRPGTDSDRMDATCSSRPVRAGGEETGRAGSAGRDRVDEAPAAGAPEQTATRGRHGRRRSFRWLPRRRRKDAAGAAGEAGATYGRNGQKVPTGLGASLVTSGGLLLAMAEDVRMRGTVEPEELRPLADTFARHCAAKEATVRKVLVRNGVATTLVERDRQEGDLIQDILDRALMGRHPEDTRTLTVDGALTTMYQYLMHERRDLVPAIERAMTREESESLAAAFEAIAAG